MKTQKKIANFLHKLLHALHFGAAAGLAYCLVAAVFVAYIFSSSWLRPAQALGYSVFSPSSFWNTTTPRHPTLHANSASFVSEIQQQVAAYGTSYDVNGGAPVYLADPSTPVVTVIPWDCDGGGINPGLVPQWQSVPIPFYAMPNDGSDKTMIIYQSSTQTMWEFERMQNVGGQWQACSGGRIVGTAGNSGVFTNPYGATDTGLALLGGQVAMSEFQAGFIGHAIGLSLPNTSGSMWPAARSGGNGAASIPQGLRLQLDPSLDVNSLGLSAAGRAVARAAQVYGFVVWDSASTVSVMGESPKSYTTRGLPDPYGGSMAGALQGFPWHKLRALPPAYGQFGPPAPNISSFSTPSTNLLGGQQPTFSWQSIDVDSCAIPGVAGGLAATGTTTGVDLRSATNYTLTCSGPGGSASRALAIGVSGLPENESLPPIVAITLKEPATGNVVVIPELATPEAAITIQKVVYYEGKNWLAAVTTPPFALDTSRLSDGKHTFNVQIYYRDGSRTERTVEVVVQNKVEQLALPAPPAPTKETNAYVRYAVHSLGIAGAFGAMGLASWYGWRKTHWL